MRYLTHFFDPFRPALGAPPQSLWPFLRWCTRGSELAVGFMALCFLLAGVAEVGSAYIIGRLVDATANASPQGFFAQNATLLIFGLLFFAVFKPVINGLSALSTSVMVAPNLHALIRMRLFRWTLKQHLQFFEEDFSGRLAQKQLNTSNAMVGSIIEFCHSFLYALATLAATVLLLGSIDLRLAPLMVLWIAAYALLLGYFNPRIRESALRRANAGSGYTGQIVDVTGNIKTVKLFAHAELEDQKTLDASKMLRETGLDYGWIKSRFSIFLHGVSGLMTAAMVGLSMYLWTTGAISIGGVAAATTVAVRISQMAGWVSFSLMEIYSDLGEIEDGMDTLTPAPKVTDQPQAPALNVTHGQICLENVHFSYGQNIGGLRGVSLNIASGEKLGIVGASGAGKSTLISLLLRLYDLENGQITIDDQDITKVTQASLRANIALVSQETELFNRSALDNIAYGQPHADKEAIIKAATRAAADEFIQLLKDLKGRAGYDAHLGERGVKLSGGQRQRIALARAILKDAPILVLDEATSALDSALEAEIQAALHDVMGGKTVIAIAHRLSTLQQMDRIIVLDKGQIVEHGSHTLLLAKDGLYAKFWARQAGGFIQTDLAS